MTKEIARQWANEKYSCIVKNGVAYPFRFYHFPLKWKYYLYLRFIFPIKYKRIKKFK